MYYSTVGSVLFRGAYLYTIFTRNHASEHHDVYVRTVKHPLFIYVAYVIFAWNHIFENHHVYIYSI